MTTVAVKNYTKTIRKNTVLNKIDLTLESGSATGLYGHNGSGKSMLLRAISGLIHPTEGSVQIDSLTLGKDISFPKDLGLIIENVGFWDGYTGFENLKMLSAIRGIISDEEIKSVIQRVGLNPNDKRSYSKYSLGMKQRLGIAQAIMENPTLLLLDEPTNALDEEGIKVFYEIIAEQKKRGVTIVITSHNKEDLLNLCDSVYKMDNGNLSPFDFGDKL